MIVFAAILKTERNKYAKAIRKDYIKSHNLKNKLSEVIE